MPTFQAITERMNVLFNRENIDKLDPARFSLDQEMSDETFRELRIVTTDQELEYLRSWPHSVMAALRAAIHSGVNRTPRIPVTIAWSPGYDFEVQISEAPGTSTSIGGITILVRGRYPADTHPTQR